MRRMLALVFALLAYALFFVAFVYAVGFVGGLVVPKSIDTGAAGSRAVALLVDALLLTLFAVQHSGMARRRFKRWLTRFIPEPIERSTYVLVASLVLLLVFGLWHPIGGTVWRVTAPAGVATLWTLFALGWAVVFFSTFMIGHAELFGLRQAWMHLRGQSRPTERFRTPLLYRVVRHPIMLGFLIAFWSAPVMSAGHLLFSIATTGYILLAVQVEERDLVARHGEAYRQYRREVPAFVPIPGRAASREHAPDAASAEAAH